MNASAEPALSSLQSKFSVAKYVSDLFVSVCERLSMRSRFSPALSTLSLAVGIIHFRMNFERCAVNKKTTYWMLCAMCSVHTPCSANHALYDTCWSVCVNVPHTKRNERKNERIMVRFMLSDLIRTGEDEWRSRWQCNAQINAVRHIRLHESQLVPHTTARCIQWKLIRWMFKVFDILYICLGFGCRIWRLDVVRRGALWSWAHA